MLTNLFFSLLVLFRGRRTNVETWEEVYDSKSPTWLYIMLLGTSESGTYSLLYAEAITTQEWVHFRGFVDFRMIDPFCKVHRQLWEATLRRFTTP